MLNNRQANRISFLVAQLAATIYFIFIVLASQAEGGPQRWRMSDFLFFNFFLNITLSVFLRTILSVTLTEADPMRFNIAPRDALSYIALMMIQTLMFHGTHHHLARQGVSVKCFNALISLFVADSVMFRLLPTPPPPPPPRPPGEALRLALGELEDIAKKAGPQR